MRQVQASAGGWPWQRRRERAVSQALLARDEASVAFLEMDRAQQHVRTRVRSLVRLEPGPDTDAVAREHADLDARVEATSAAWIATLDAHPDLDDAEVAAAERAEADFRRLGSGMAQARADLDGFLTRRGAVLARVDRALEAVPLRVAAAAAAVADAEAVLHAVGEDGIDAPRATGRLDGARAALASARRGAAAEGVAALLARCDEAVRLAGEARRLAEELPRVRDAVRRGLLATATKQQVVAARTEPLAVAMSRLRREFVHAAWSDVEDAPRRHAEGLTRAADRLRAARALADRGGWEEAAAALAESRAAARAALAAADAALDRLAALEQVAADPRGAVAGARFAVRDAQRLLLAGTAYPDLVQVLDGLAARLVSLEETYAGPAAGGRPDYGRLLRALEEIRVETAHVVRTVRSRRASGR